MRGYAQRVLETAGASLSTDALFFHALKKGTTGFPKASCTKLASACDNQAMLEYAISEAF